MCETKLKTILEFLNIEKKAYVHNRKSLDISDSEKDREMFIWYGAKIDLIDEIEGFAKGLA